MCGIIGIVARDLSHQERETLVSAMGDTIRHRGPDSSGVWSADSTNSEFSAQAITLGHRRLAIVDLTPNGHQPMLSSSGRYAVTFNGEIYNYRELLEELSHSGFTMRGTSDTEVLLGAFESFGVEIALQKFNGMFSLAVYDRRERVVILARDRFGEKPLYYGVTNTRLAFSSELRPFKPVSEGDLNISRPALRMLMRYNCVPAPYTIFEEVLKLPPGHIVAIPVERAFRNISDLPKPTKYYDAESILGNALTNRFSGTTEEAIEELDRRVRSSVSQQMVADVPVGAFLSGGIDSSTVVGIMQALSSRPVQTFSIGFSEDEYNEAPFAKQVAQHLHTNHSELLVTPADALSVIPNLAKIFDEPFADSSQIPTYLVAKLARQHVTVSLSGDGGDEIFGGYERYRWTERIWKTMRLVPSPIRSALGAVIERTPLPAINSILTALQRTFPSLSGFHNPGDKLLRLAALLGTADLSELYHRLLIHWNDVQLLVPRSAGNETLHAGPLVIDTLERTSEMTSEKEWMMLYDLLTYLPDDILTKVDRAAMAVSLETRVPLLDHRVVEFAFSLPETMRFRNGETKWILRQVLKRYVPETLFDRPKRGFSIPLDRWLAGPLRDWARDLLEPINMEQLGYLNPIAVQAAWEEHTSGLRPRHNQLWNVLMFCAWHKSYFSN